MGKSMQFLCMRAHVRACLRIHMYAHARVYANGLKSHLQAIRKCQHLGERTDLTAHRASWAKEHLAGITMFCLAPRAAVWAVTAITMPGSADSCFARLNGLMEYRIRAGVKYLHHKLKRFAVWTVARFYNNFHLKLAQYIFNEFFYKTFNSPQFISSGKWLSSLKWWAWGCLCIHYLRRKKQLKKKMIFPNRVFSCVHIPMMWKHLCLPILFLPNKRQALSFP